MSARRRGLVGCVLAVALGSCDDVEGDARGLVSETLAVPSAAAAPPPRPAHASPLPPPPGPGPQTEPDREKLRRWRETGSIVFPKGMHIRIEAQYRDVVERNRLVIEAAACPNGPPETEDPKCPWAGLRGALREEPGRGAIDTAMRSCLALATLKLEAPRERALTVTFEGPPGRVSEPLDPDFGFNRLGDGQASFFCTLE